MVRPLAIRHLWKSYAAGVRGCSARIWVLRDLSLTVEWGERILVVGAAGTGKTTLIECVTGLRRPDAGTVDAPGLATGVLVVATVREWQARFASRCTSPASVLLVGEAMAPACSIDRVLALRDGQLVPAGAAMRRLVAEPRPERFTPVLLR